MRRAVEQSFLPPITTVHSDPDPLLTCLRPVDRAQTTLNVLNPIPHRQPTRSHRYPRLLPTVRRKTAMADRRVAAAADEVAQMLLRRSTMLSSCLRAKAERQPQRRALATPT